MAYKNIVFVKLEKRLLNDHRWYMMSDNAQLIYIKLILLAAETYNKIPKNDTILKEALRSRLELKDFIKCVEEVKKNFPKLTTGRHFTYFKEFEFKTNYIPKQEIPSKPLAIAQRGVEEEKEEDKNKKKIRPPKLSDSEFIESLKTNPVYKGIDIDREFGKMDTWLLTNPGRQKTRRFIIKWLNRIEIPIDTKKESKYKPVDKNCKFCNGTGFLYNQSKSSNEICKCRILT